MLHSKALGTPNAANGHDPCAPATCAAPRRRPSAARAAPPRPRLAPRRAAVEPAGGLGGAQQLRQAGPGGPAPDYRGIDASPLNVVVMTLFRRKMVDAIGCDSQLQGCAGIGHGRAWARGAGARVAPRGRRRAGGTRPCVLTAPRRLAGRFQAHGPPPNAAPAPPAPRRSYPAIIDLTRRLNRSYPTARETQLATRAILNSLFPSWLPRAFAALFSRPLPAFSCRLNAFATAATCQWLMGLCKVNDVEIDGGQVRRARGRARGCPASVARSLRRACKSPRQAPLPVPCCIARLRCFSFQPAGPGLQRPRCARQQSPRGARLRPRRTPPGGHRHGRAGGALQVPGGGRLCLDLHQQLQGPDAGACAYKRVCVGGRLCHGQPT